jgi:hypothetical protein
VEPRIPAAEPLVNVAVPERHLPEVYRLLGQLMARESAATQLPDEVGCPHCGGLALGGSTPGGYQCAECGLAFGRTVAGVVVDHENGCWTELMVRRLKAEIRSAVVVGALDRIAASAPETVGYDELLSSLSVDQYQLRAELGALSKVSRRLFGRKIWPLSARQGWGGGDRMGYRMPVQIAAWWRDARSDGLVEAGTTSTNEERVQQIRVR